MNTTEILRDLASLIPHHLAAHVAVCEFSSEDNTPTLHVDLWRQYGLHDLPEAVASLFVASEGNWDGGDSYSLQLLPETNPAQEPSTEGGLLYRDYFSTEVEAAAFVRTLIGGGVIQKQNGWYHVWQTN